MSRRKKLPHCFYCEDVTHGSLSRIDNETPVCTDCAWVESVDPQKAFDRWIGLGGDRAAALAFADAVNAKPRAIPLRTPELLGVNVGGAR